MSSSEPNNPVLFQAFEWHTDSEPPPPHETHSAGSHWRRLADILPHLSLLGVTSIWLPPGCKANHPRSNGYDCYDLWDLGEFDQKWTRSTKWGSKEELGGLLEAAEKSKVDVIWDAVLNHKTAGDTTDETWAVEVDKRDRRVEICPPKKISAWLRYDFPGRDREGMKYSGFRWRAEHFNGTDWDQYEEKNAIFKLIDDPATHHKTQPVQPATVGTASISNRLTTFIGKASGKIAKEERKEVARRPGKGWADDVDMTFGNHDYLMFSNIYYSHPQVREDVLNWGKWMIYDVGVRGFRLDAAQHISWTYTRKWISQIQATSHQRRGRYAMIIGEIWAGEVSRQLRWLDAVTSPGAAHQVYAFDAPLVYSFSRVAEDVRKGSRNADLRTLLAGPAGFADAQALVSLRPAQAVTCVTNHDTQAGQASYVPMETKIKDLFYAFVLLRREGYPCVFWGDMHGTRGPFAEPPVPNLRQLMLARKLFAYGPQQDYFDDSSCIGWVRTGTRARPGCAVVLSIKAPGVSASRCMAVDQPGQTWINILSPQNARHETVIDKQGWGDFSCHDANVAVWVNQAFASVLATESSAS